MYDFETRLAKVGLQLGNSGEIDAVVAVKDVDALRDLLDTGLNDTQRAEHLQAMFDGINTSSDSVLERVERFLVGADPLSHDDRAAIAPMFPMHVRVIASAEPKTINSEWNLSSSDGRLVTVLLSTFTIEQGGYVTCGNTPLQFQCDTLIRNGNTGSAASDFNILGATGASLPTPAAPATPGQATAGKGGECSSVGISGPGGQTGVTGATGTNGVDGTPGNSGQPSQMTNITITSALNATQLTIATRSGTGGQGGPGGPGGQAGQGGNGGNGVSCDCTGNGGGSGAQGGTGGTGGQGGTGGNAVDANANVVVTLPAKYQSLILGLPQQVPPGVAGTPGSGGGGGPGGGGGTAGKNNNAGSGGSTGAAGPTGPQGTNGTVPGKAALVQTQPY